MKKIKSVLAIILVSFCLISKSQAYPYATFECGNLKVNYGIRYNLVGKGTSYTLTQNDYLAVCSASITLTIPTAVGVKGKVYIIKNGSTSGTLTPVTTLSQTISGFTTGIVPNGAVTIISDNVNWQCINYFVPQ